MPVTWLLTIVAGGLSEGMIEPGHPDAIVGLLGHIESGYLMACSTNYLFNKLPLLLKYKSH